MVAMEHKRKTSWDSKISVSTASARRFSRAGTPSSILSSDSDIRFTRKLGSQYRCGCCVLAAFLAFLLFAGVSVYLGYTFLLSDQPNEQIFLATFRVIKGDAFTAELAEPTSEQFQKRSRSYRDRINLLFRRSSLQLPFIAAEILALDGIENQDLTVHFDARFDSRYATVESSDILEILRGEFDESQQRIFANLTVEPASLEVQESASAANKLALRTNSSGTDANEPTTTMMPKMPRKCSAIEFSYCKHLPYNATSYPNFAGHEDLQQVMDEIIAYRELVDAECYKQAYDFICQVLQPACTYSNDVAREDATSPPCRSFCREFWSGCGSRLSDKLKGVLDCSRFPEYADHEGGCRAKPGCIKELQANALSSRVCDGIVDCPDFTDEKDCAYCRGAGNSGPDAMHCGLGSSCIPRSKRCDGKVDCPNGSDERDCLSLAPSVRSLRLQPLDAAHPAKYSREGYVVFNEKGSLGKICTENLNETLRTGGEIAAVLRSTASSLCALLTYESVESVEIRVDDEENVAYVLMQDPAAAEITFVRAPCKSRQVMYVRCGELACGTQAIRSKPGPGASRTLNKMAGPGDWPWHVALLKEDSHVCDATLVASSWLLTTASCFQGQPKAEWSARLGTIRLSSSSPWQQERRIVGMVKSPVEGSTVVLLKMDLPVAAFSDFVRPVCLPKSGDVIANASQCNTLGWAKNRDILQRVQVRYNPMERCENVSIASVNSVCTEAVYSNDDCAEEEVAGSPLVCQLADSRRWSLLGVGNWRIACSKSGLERPRLYDQITSNLAWIRSTIADA